MAKEIDLQAQIGVAKAKLYNLKSAVDGMVQLVDQGVLSPQAVKDGISALSARLYDDMTKQGL